MTSFLAPVLDHPLEPGPVPTFSIVIPAYQAASFVVRAVESALAQTTPALEIIVSDDGSTDDLGETLEPYRDRVKVVQGPHAGPPTARNRGFRAASGDFVANLDADDVLYPDWLEALAELAVERPDLDVLITDSFLVHDGKPLRRCYSKGWVFPTDDQRRRILQRSFVTNIAAVRRTRFLDIGGFDESIPWCDDWDFWLRLILDGSRAGCVDEPLAEYTVRPESISARRGDVLRGSVRLLEKAEAEQNLELRELEDLALSLAKKRRELARLELQEALARRDPHARRHVLVAALDSGYGSLTRLKMTVSAAVPGLAYRLLQRRNERAWVGAGGARVKRR